MEKKNGGGDTVPAALMFRYINEKEMKQRRFAEQIGESEQTLVNWKTRGIPRGKVAAVAHAMGLTYEEYCRDANARPTKTSANKRTRIAPASDSIAIPVFDVEGSMGVGRVVPSHEPVVGGLTLSREWVRGRLGSVTSLNNLAVISAFGDSMTPTFNDGDILLVDRGVSDVKIDAVYVLGRGDELFVKRLQRRLGGEIVIRSDNPLFEPETVSGEALEGVRVLGRVVWVWNGKRL